MVFQSFDKTSIIIKSVYLQTVHLLHLPKTHTFLNHFSILTFLHLYFAKAEVYKLIKYSKFQQFFLNVNYCHNSRVKKCYDPLKTGKNNTGFINNSIIITCICQDNYYV